MPTRLQVRPSIGSRTSFPPLGSKHIVPGETVLSQLCLHCGLIYVAAQ